MPILHFTDRNFAQLILDTCMYKFTQTWPSLFYPISLFFLDNAKNKHNHHYHGHIENRAQSLQSTRIDYTFMHLL